MEFKYDIRDLQFITKEWLPTEEVFACERFREYFSIDDVDMYLNEGYKVAREIVNPVNAKGDENGTRYENGKIIPVEGYREAYKFLQENGWGSSASCIELEGGMPLMLYRMIHEMNTAACPALVPYVGLTTGVANLLIKFGTEKDKELFLPKLLNGDWQGTMCLTEPNAGSDVGDAITRAYPTNDPWIWKIKGTKMFITGADAGICENTINMVLARPEGGAPGSGGLGLYIVPKIWVNDDGSLGEPNDASVVSIEHKMGCKGSATCLLNFGDNDNCRGIRLGPLPDDKGRSKGLVMMFHMMNEARMGTGLSALAQAAAAYYFASQYATERIQGRPFGDNKADRVPIIKHEDIRRMLLDMKAHVEGVRAMIYKGLYYLDIQENSGDAERAAECGALAEVFTPLVKAYASEVAVNLISEAIQVLGGVGYTREYPVEQYLRDSKILTIWEGTTYIHANDLVGRKMRMKEGAVFARWISEINNFVERNKNVPEFEKEIQTLKKGVVCVEELKALYDSWYADLEQKKSFIPSTAVRSLFVCSQVQVAQCLLEQALIARNRLAELPADDYECTFYRGKVAAARYYTNQVLPNVFSLTDIIKSEDTAIMDCPEEALVVR